MNKYERNAVEVSLDSFIDSIIDIRSYFEKPISFDTLSGLGDWTLNLIKTHLEYDIDGMTESLEDSEDKEELEYFTELLSWQHDALNVINKAIKYNKSDKKQTN